MSRAHAIISTHTTRHLRRTLLGVLAQSRPPDSIIISCDSDARDIADLVGAVGAESTRPLTLVQRPFQGASRSSQVRNNAVRALLFQPHAPDDHLWFLDGDCLPAPDCLTNLLSCSSRAPGGGGGRVSSGDEAGRGGGGVGGRGALVIAFRIDLTPEQTDAITDTAITSGNAVMPTPAQLDSLRARARRYRRTAILRRVGLAKSHKPKLLSANFGVRLADYLAVNGFDEEYAGYGQEDDDLGRRLYKIGVRPVIGVMQALAYHQYHPTRAPQAWEKSPNAQRFARPFTPICTHGVENPVKQPTPTVQHFEPALEYRP